MRPREEELNSLVEQAARIAEHHIYDGDYYTEGTDAVSSSARSIAAKIRGPKVVSAVQEQPQRDGEL